VEDLKGLKIRSAGLAANMLSELGASVVTISPGEVYQALERGVVDAAEFASIPINYTLGLHEVTKYIVFPGFSGAPCYDLIASMKAWEKLPDDLKEIVKVSMNECNLLYNYSHELKTRTLMEKLQNDGMIFIQWSDEDMAKLNPVRVKAWEKYAERSPEAKEVFESRMKTLKILGYKY
jgi:TRAP-type mannitol/chloroaromatic compound transport system substrate-binding protein